MNIKESNTLEIELLLTIPEDKRGEFIERFGQPLRELIDTFEYEDCKERMEALTRDYVGIE